MMPDDLDLLERYRDRGDEQAFRSLVDRHLPVVYGLALRRTGDRETAEEVAQSVFSTLAQKTRQGLEIERSLGAWLYGVALKQSLATFRRERSRRKAMKTYREREEMVGHEEVDPAARLVLDEALGKLPARDREVVFLRYIEGRSYKEVGEVCGKSEDAARKQVERALEKLSRALGRRGHPITASVVGTGITVGLAPQVPAAVTRSVCRVALAPGAAAPGAGFLGGALAGLPVPVFTGVAALVAFALPIAGQLRRNSVTREPSERFLVEKEPVGNTRPAQVGHAPNEVPRARDVAAILHSLAKRGKRSGHMTALLGEFMSSLSLGELPVALAVFPDLSVTGSNAKLQVGQALFARWVALDPSGATAEAFAQQDLMFRRGAIWGVIRSLTSVSPDGAAAFVESIMDRDFREFAETAYWGALGASDPAEAVAKASQLEDANARVRFVEQILRKWAEGDPGGAIEWVTTAEDPDGLRPSRIESVSRRLAEIDPPSALAAVERFLEGRALDRTVGRIFSRWAEGDPRSALDAARELSALTPERELDVIQRIGRGVRTWDKALVTISSAQDARERDALIGGIAYTTQDRWDRQPGLLPELAALVDTISLPKLKIEAASRLYSGWHGVAPEQAKVWYDGFREQNPSARDAR